MAWLDRCPDHGTTFTKGCLGCRASRRNYQQRLRAERTPDQQPPRKKPEKPRREAAISDPYPGLTIVEGDLSWHDHAACKGAETAMFFRQRIPEGEQSKDAAAIAVCANCPVTEPCLNYALRTNQKYGVWGGKTAKQRRQLPKPDPICCDCHQPFPRPTTGMKNRCAPCQAAWRRSRQQQWHHEVGKFRDEATG